MRTCSYRRALPLLIVLTALFGVLAWPLPGAAAPTSESSASPSSEKLAVTVTQPWLALIASFIGGPNVTVTSLQDWNAEGDLVRARRGRGTASQEDAHLMALDPAEAQRAGLKVDEFPSLRFLYTPFPIAAEEIDAALTDPSALPFVAQRVLTVLSGWDPSNYAYYQRRLAEFQARLSSSILAGRQVLRDVPVCDLSGASGPLLRAAGCKVLRPDPQQFAAWGKGGTAGLREYLEARKAEGVIVVMDEGTPRALRRYLSGRSGTFKFGRPSLEQDYPAFLHDQYISLWQTLTTKPLPGGKRR